MTTGTLNIFADSGLGELRVTPIEQLTAHWQGKLASLFTC